MSVGAEEEGAVELSGVGYAVGRARILDDVSARFIPGRFNVVVGPNGAGKSTLLRIATGALRPTSGSVSYGGRPLAAYGADALARVRAVLSQHVELAFPLPADEVVLMGRYPHFGRAPAPADRAIVARALDLVGMAERSGQPYQTLSGGEQQKVQLARVLAQIWRDVGDGSDPEPRYLFLDEPTSSLDVHYQLQLLDVARSLLEHGVTVVAVLHDLNVAFRYADHLLVLERGRVAFDGGRGDEPPAPLLERVFQVRARRVADAATGESLWSFSLG